MPYPPCEKSGCPLPGRFLVELHAADGDLAFRACRDHAEAFGQWVVEETERQGGQWAYTVMEWTEPE